MANTASIRPENVNAPATKRQLWALFCATKKDYRNDNLTRAAAADLLAKANENRVLKPKSSASSLENEMIDYFKAKIMPRVVASLRGALGIESVVSEDTSLMKGTGPNGEARNYMMRGFGCSISYLKYDKRSKLAARIEEMFRKLRFTTFEKLVCNEFDNNIRVQLKREGTPIEALYCQDYDVNSTLFWGIVNFAKEKGVKNIDYITRLD